MALETNNTFQDNIEKSKLDILVTRLVALKNELQDAIKNEQHNRAEQVRERIHSLLPPFHRGYDTGNGI